MDSTKYPSTAAGGHERRGNSGVRLRVLIQDDMQGTSSTVYLIIWDVLVKTPPPRRPPGSLSWHAFGYWRARGYTHLLSNDPGLDDVERMREYIVDTYLVFNRKIPFFFVC